MSKAEPLKSFINKVGTFRGKKSSNRPSVTDLKYSGEHGNGDESMFKVPSSIDENGLSTTISNESCLDLDTTQKNFSNRYLIINVCYLIRVTFFPIVKQISLELLIKTQIHSLLSKPN